MDRLTKQLMHRSKHWYVEVQNSLRIVEEVQEGRIIHLSLATLGTVTENVTDEYVTVYVTIDDKKLVLGTLSVQTPQIKFNLFFEREFELSHNREDGSIIFSGYQTRSARDLAEDKWGAVNVPETEEQVQTRFLTRLEHLRFLIIEMSEIKESISNTCVLISQWYLDEDGDIEDLIHHVKDEISMSNLAVILRREVTDTIGNLNGYQLYYAETKIDIMIISDFLFHRPIKVVPSVIVEDDIDELYAFGIINNMQMKK